MFPKTLYTIVFWALLGSTAITAADEMSPRVDYNAAKDQLSLNVKEVLLSKVLTQISAAAEVQILMVPEADHAISITLDKRPLESGLKQLVRGVNHVMYYENRSDTTDAAGTPVMVAMKVLPRGSQDQTGLTPLLPRADETKTAGDGSIAPHPAFHRQIPMDRWPKANRKQMAEHMQHYQTLRKMHEKRRDDNKVKRDARMQEKQNSTEDNNHEWETPPQQP